MTNKPDLPFPEIQLELPFEPEPSKRFDHFENFLARLSDEYAKPKPNTDI